MNFIYYGDNLPLLREMPKESVDLIYIDPPFNTGKVQSLTAIKTVRGESGDRIGFQGNSYQTIEVGTKAYQDIFDKNIEFVLSPEVREAYHRVAPEASLGFIEGFLRPRLVEAYRILKPHGSLYFHIDYREVHYCKILLDSIFGRNSFINEIIWAYDYGGKSKTRWPPKHDNILFYVKDPENYIFNSEAIDREPYMAPGLVGPDKASRGKLPTDTWWHTIVGTNSKERTGYPTQKPIGVINRIIQASSLPGQTVMDFFAGSGTVGECCIRLDRRFILIDNNRTALEVMAKRFAGVKNIEWVNFDPSPFQDEKTEAGHKKKDGHQDDFDFLASLAKYYRSEYEGGSEMWEGSPFDWMVELTPPKKGSLGKKMLATWCQMKGLNVQDAPEKGADILINGCRCAIKFSFLWSDGIYKFQQIRDQEYDYVICLGLSPSSAHCWVMKKDYALAHSTSQHGGLHGSDTNWFSVDPSNPEDWLKSCGGALESAYKILASLKR